MAPPYSRAAPLSMPDHGDQMLAANLLPAMYPPLPPLHNSQHPGIPVAGHGVVTNLAMAGYHQHHHHSMDPSVVTSRLALGGGDGLPDIVHSHSVVHALPPRPNHHRSGNTAAGAVSRQQRQRQQQSSGGGGGGNGRRRGERDRDGQQRRRNHTQTSSSAVQGESGGGRCKEPCVKCLVVVTSLRWVLVLLSILGVLFIVAGIIMAALHAVGNDFLIYALVFIGLGVLLVAVVFVTWKTSPPGAEPIHALFNISNNSQSSRRERRPRRTRRARDGQWHGGMMYPEFQYRRPPPSYAASMQAYHAQMMEAQSNNNSVTLANNNSSQSQESYSLPGSPPPSYRSRASTIHSGVHITFPPGHDSAPNSRPPTYRSRANSHPRPRLSMDDMEPYGGAQSDISFAGPVLTAEDVQQIIGTNRRCHQHARTDAGHTRSASLDLAQGPEVPLHHRGSSLDLALTSDLAQGPEVPLHHRGSSLDLRITCGTKSIVCTQDSPQEDRTERDRRPGSPPKSTVLQTADCLEPQHEGCAETASADRPQVVVQGDCVQRSGSERVLDDGGRVTVRVVVDRDVVTRTSGNVSSEPDQYNTAL